MLKLSKQQDVDLDSDLNSAVQSGPEEDLFSVKQALCIATDPPPRFENDGVSLKAADEEIDVEEKQALLGESQPIVVPPLPIGHRADDDKESQDYSELKYGTE